MSKRLYIIAGCNGAGKTTASYTVLPEMLKCHEFVNADEIARGLSPFNPEGVAIEAGRLMLHRIDELLSTGATFAIETTLATRSYINLIQKAKDEGYIVTLLFFWLHTPELALQRVAERVRLGGHNIPEDTLRRRYILGLSNLFNLFIDKVDRWIIQDNSDSRLIPIAHGGYNTPTTIHNNELFTQMQAYVR